MTRKNRRCSGSTLQNRLERLEERTVPTSISGMVWKNSLGGPDRNGGEIAYGGVLVSVYQDGGNGKFDNGGGDDLFVASQMTFGDGTYGFFTPTGKLFVDIDQTNPLLANQHLGLGSDPRVYDLTATDDILDAHFGWVRNAPPTTSGGNTPPGTFPIRASGASVNIAPLPGSILNGANSNNLSVSVVGQGPYQWTESRHNEGDISFSLNPADPVAGAPPAGFVDNFAAAAQTPTTFAWRIHKETGLSFATPRKNGFNNGDFVSSGGSAVGTVYGAVHFNTDSSGGRGYSPATGVYLDSGGNSQDMQMGIVGLGAQPGGDEGSFPVGVANFPFDEGWIGGYVDDVTDGPNAIFDQGFGAPGLVPSTMVTWVNLVEGLATVDITGLNSAFNPTNGLLFVAPNEGVDNNVELAAAMPNGMGWTVALREGKNLDVTGATLTTLDRSEFQFMYVDMRYKGAIAARVDGATGNVLQQAGGATITRLSTGRYSVTIPGENDASGMLMLSVSGAQAGLPTLPSRSFLSYQHDTGNTFIVEARQLTTGGNPFGQDSVLTDTTFNFAWVDFSNPMQPVLPLPTVSNIAVNNGNAQRSLVNSVKVTFSEAVSFPMGIASAFDLQRTGNGSAGTVGLSFNHVGADVTITFNGLGTISLDPGSSLQDGTYTLTIVASKVQGANGVLDGNGDGVAGDNKTSAFHRLFGDSTGDGAVNTFDFAVFRSVFGLGASVFDFNNDGLTNASDFASFRARFGLSGYLP